jgi:RecA/RadA recombinase
MLNGNVKFKEQKWIPFSKALQNSISVTGAPVGHITLLRGHSNTGKTTALLELAISAQKMNILPVFIITEMKWSWEHARTMGFQIDDVVD